MSTYPMTNKTLIVLIGLPCSGKSTAANKTPFPIVNADAIRVTLTGETYHKEAEPIVWAHAQLMVASLFRAGHDVVVLDSCNLTRTHREVWSNMNWTVKYIVFDTPPTVCKERAVQSGQDFLLEPITRYNNQKDMKDVYPNQLLYIDDLGNISDSTGTLLYEGAI